MFRISPMLRDGPPAAVRGPVLSPPWFLQRVNRLLLVLQIALAWQGVPRREHRGYLRLRATAPKHTAVTESLEP